MDPPSKPPWPTTTSATERGDVLDAVRGCSWSGRDRARTWWVNQGKTYSAELVGGYVWAPTVMKNGRPSRYHTNVSLLRPGDTIVHYANGAIRSISQVRCEPETRPRPTELPTEAWGAEGHYCTVEYFPLEVPIALEEIADRSGADGPFDKDGGVKQSYLLEMSQAFADRLKAQFTDRWPSGCPLADGERRFWLFQANPRVWDLESFLATATKGTTDSWTASRYRAEMQPGDGVVHVGIGANRGALVFSRLAGEPFERERPDWKSDDEPPTEWAVPIVVDTILDHPVIQRSGSRASASR